MDFESSILRRPGEARWIGPATIGLAVALGLSASHPILLAALLSVLFILVAGRAGEFPLLALVVIPLGVSFSFLTDGPKAMIPGLEGGSIDGLRLVVALGAFGFLAARNPTVLGYVREVPIYVIFLAFAAMTLLWTPSALDGLRLLFKLTYPLVAFIVARRVLETRGDRPLIVLLRIAAIVSVGLNVLVVLIGVSPFMGVGYEERFGGASHPNTVGLFSAAVGLILYASYLKRRSWPDLIVAMVLAVQLIATGSRTALLSGGVAFLILEAVRGKWMRVGIALGAAILIWLVVPSFGERTLAPAAGAEGSLGGSGVNLSGRMDLWLDAWSSLMGGSQAIGKGLGTTESFFTSRYASLRSIHNGYLLLIIDTGIAGFLMMLVFLMSTGWKLASSLRALRSKSIYTALAIGSLAMFLLASLTEGTFGGYSYPALLWLTFALATADSAVPPLGREAHS